MAVVVCVDSMTNFEVTLYVDVATMTIQFVELRIGSMLLRAEKESEEKESGNVSLYHPENNNQNKQKVLENFLLGL